MRRAHIVDVYTQPREAAHEHPRRAGVVEVDVGQEQRPRLSAQPLEQRVEARRGARIDDHAVELVGGDYAVVAEVHEVDLVDHT